MDATELRQSVVEELLRIAPELADEEISGSRPLREQVDLDSMDWLNFLVALHERLKIDIPEADYARLATIDQIVAYLSAKSAP
jgi:acyl carrier protein